MQGYRRHYRKHFDFFSLAQKPLVDQRHLSMVHDHTQTHHTGMTSGRVINPMQRPPDNKQHLQDTNIHAPAGFEPAIQASGRPQTHALDLAATRIGSISIGGCKSIYHTECELWLRLSGKCLLKITLYGQTCRCSSRLIALCVCCAVMMWLRMRFKGNPLFFFRKRWKCKHQRVDTTQRFKGYPKIFRPPRREWQTQYASAQATQIRTGSSVDIQRSYAHYSFLTPRTYEPLKGHHEVRVNPCYGLSCLLLVLTLWTLN